MRNPIVLIFIVTIISVLLIAGCSQPQTVAQTPPPTTAVPTSVQTIPTPEQTTVAQPSVTVPVVASSTTAANTTVTQKPPTTIATTKLPTTVAYSSDSSDSPTPAPDPNVVMTDTGFISGIQENGLRVYLGIPFAAPPTGDLRWRPPAPAQPWDGVKETKTFCAACPQPPNASPGLVTNEDCLYLNVWTPANSANEKLPVMVFFYGGAFGKIAGQISTYNGTALAQKEIGRAHV